MNLYFTAIFPILVAIINSVSFGLLTKAYRTSDN